MSEKPTSSHTPHNEDAVVGSKTRRRRGKRSRRGQSQDIADTPANQEQCSSLSSEGTTTPSPEVSCNSTPASLSPVATSSSDPEEQYDPLRDTNSLDTIPAYDSEVWRSHMPKKVARDPFVSGWFNAKLDGIRETAHVTPWSLFHRGSLINIAAEEDTYSDEALILNHMLQMEVSEATLRLVEYFKTDLDKAGRDTEDIRRKFVEMNASSATAAVDKPRPQESGAARRYRHIPRLFGCSICYARLPSRRSLEKHFLTHKEKDALKMAMCVACGFPAAQSTMLEWHVFVSHKDVARMLVSRHWPRLCHKDHSGCSYCSIPNFGELSVSVLQDLMELCNTAEIDLSSLNDKPKTSP